MTKDMGKWCAYLVLLANLTLLKCQEELINNVQHQTSTGNPSYTYSYGVSDVQTGDVKTVWESREGDSVKGHYSVLEADGSMRTVEYSANPKTGFKAVVNNDGEKTEQSEGRSYIEDKAMRDYGKYYDFSEEADTDIYLNEREKKRGKNSYETAYKGYSSKKRPKYPDLESSDFSHSITIKHPRDPSGAEGESHSHFEPHYKTKKKPNYLSEVVEFDIHKPHELKFPFLSTEHYKDDYLKYEPSNVDYEKYVSPYGSKVPKFEGPDYEKFFGTGEKALKFEDFRPSQPLRHKYPVIPDIPEGYYPDELPPRPKKKRPHKKPVEYHYPAEDVEDYWVPKKKKKHPPRVVEPEYLPEEDEEYERPRYPSDFEDDEEEDSPPRPPRPPKKVIKKIIKKKRPTFNLLDILDI